MQEAAALKRERDEALARERAADERAHWQREQATRAQAACAEQVTASQLEARSLADQLQRHATDAVSSAEAAALQQMQAAQLRIAALEGETATLSHQNQQLHDNLQVRTRALPSRLRFGLDWSRPVCQRDAVHSQSTDH